MTIQNLPFKNRFRRPRHEIVIPARVARRAGISFSIDQSGCWISTYSVASHGYAQIGWHEGGRRYGTTAHRAAWVHANGQQIPEGMTVDHICKVRRCVNPGHLRVLDNFENARRTNGRDWPTGECINGHPNSELYWNGTKYLCRECNRSAQRRYRQRHPDRVRDSQRRYREKKRKRDTE